MESKLESLVEKELRWADHYEGNDPEAFSCTLPLPLKRDKLCRQFLKWLDRSSIRGCDKNLDLDSVADTLLAGIDESNSGSRDIRDTGTHYLSFRLWERRKTRNPHAWVSLEIIRKQETLCD